MVKERVAALVKAAAFLFLFVTGIWAQSNGTIQGTVTDSSGAAVPNVNVSIKNQATNETRAIKTDNSGLYNAPSLPPGSYRVEVQATGFQTEAATNLTLSVSSTIQQNFKLQVASSSQTMVVTSTTPVINTSSVSVGQVIDSRTVQQIPLNGRHFTDLSLLVAGTVTPPQNGFLSAPLRGQGSFAINTAGNREDTVNFMINGVNLNDIVQNQITFQPSINTVDEFKLDNSTYPAEYGRDSGAIVNIATRAGSNDFHGELFEYLRNDAMDARNYFNPTPIQQSPFKRSNFGASAGGPLWKNRTFFFFTYEGLRQRQGLTINTVVPTAAQHIQANAGSNPVVKQLLSNVPLPNVGNSFVGSAVAPVNIDQGTANISHQLTQNDHLNAYYALQYDFRQEPTLQGDNIPGFGDVRQSHRQIFTFNESHIFSPTTVNEFRVGYNRIWIEFAPFVQTNPQSIGIGDGITGAVGLPQITIKDSGVIFGGPTGFPQGRGDYTAAVSDTLSRTVGKHNIKFGGEYRRSNVNSFAGDTGLFTFNTFNQFLSDQAASFSVNPATNPSRIFINALGLFVQDSYKVTDRLTLDLGMRYDWNGTPTEARDRFVEFNPAIVGLQRMKQPYKQNAKNFEPRVGFAFDPFGTQKTIIRGAYALQADQPIANLVTPLASNPPFNNPVTFSGNGTTSFVTLENAFNEVTGSGGSLSPTTVNPNFRNAYVQQWNFNIQQELTNSLGMMIGYFGNKGTDLRISRNINQLINGVSRPYAVLSAASQYDAGTKLNNITEYDSAGNSSYNALWVTATKHFSKDFEFDASYTWSKSLDLNSLNSQGTVVQNSYYISGDRGLSDFDARHRFTFNGIYDLPFKANRWVSGYEFTGVLQLQSGNPVNLITTDNAYTGTQTLRPSILTNTIPTSYTPAGSNGNIQYFPATSCTKAQPGCIFLGGSTVNAFGNLGRNVLIGPGFEDLDLAFMKTTNITERFRIQFRADAFNLMNHPNFGQPGRIVGSSTLGQITNTRFAVGDSGSSRQLQVALRFLF